MGINSEIRIDDDSGIGMGTDRRARHSDQQNIAQYPCVIDGDDAEQSADVKRFKIGRRVPGLQKNASNEEAGENEEKVHARPSHNEDTLDE
jgi:hypothetical protein